MTAAHLDGVCAIENACFSRPWSRKSIEDELNCDTSLFYAACEDGKVIGYIGMSVVLDEGYIYNVAVDPAHRSKGAGYALVDALVTYAKKNSLSFITLEVRESNKAARSLYEKFGFIKVGERKDYYSEPNENAVLMTKYFDSGI